MLYLIGVITLILLIVTYEGNYSENFPGDEIRERLKNDVYNSIDRGISAGKLADEQMKEKAKITEDDVVNIYSKKYENDPSIALNYSGKTGIEKCIEECDGNCVEYGVSGLAFCYDNKPEVQSYENLDSDLDYINNGTLQQTESRSTKNTSN